MKKNILFTICVMLAIIAQAQSIKSVEFDKFNKSLSVKTKKSILFQKGKFEGNYKVIFTIEYSNGHFTMPAEVQAGSERRWDESSTLVLLLDNEDVVTLLPAFKNVATIFHTCYVIADDDVSKLREHKVTDVRLFYVGGHFDYHIKDKDQDIILRHISLIDQEIVKNESK